MIDVETLRRHFTYEPATGYFVWRVPPRTHPKFLGERAGCLGRDGRWYVKFRGRRYIASRLAWLYMTGEWPQQEIDHRDTDRSNNRWANLRAANDSQNGANRDAASNNTSGARGVDWYARYGKWRARVKVHGRSKLLGYFENKDEAIAARNTAAVEAFGEFARAA